ncbi:hypothetical protein MUN76_04160 [Leucobacter rhizosphaerae]|uniref:Uncharacterized protein n=1 Tax=Leucobacter rhizosphaerae TaxID=2932245 RepID=A0ABY4FY27_9MICO|nr:hypothetical protein [Leucobacter rhizosphaerae]UOQ61172.1 hypothetical protein MUN76_04160 [Leucobacter rhizosphaerae]
MIATDPSALPGVRGALADGWRAFAGIWSALAAIGSTLILCAIAAESGWLLAGTLLAAAAAELVWGLGVLRAGRMLAPRLAIAVSVVVMAAATALVFARQIGWVPFAVLVVLHWSVALLAAVRLRRLRAASAYSAGSGAPASPRPGATVIAVTAAAMVVAALTTPALANTSAGEHAVPHGTSHHAH